MKKKRACPLAGHFYTNRKEAEGFAGITTVILLGFTSIALLTASANVTTNYADFWQKQALRITGHQNARTCASLGLLYALSESALSQAQVNIKLDNQCTICIIPDRGNGIQVVSWDEERGKTFLASQHILMPESTNPKLSKITITEQPNYQCSL